MSAASALLAEVALALAAAALATRSLRPLACACALAGLATPFFVRTDQPIAVFYLALYAVVVAMRVLDLVRDEAAYRPSRRVLQVLAVFDVRRATARARAFEGRLLLGGLAWFVVGALGIAAMYVGATLDGAPRLILRWGGCALTFVAAFEAIARIVPAACALKGVRPPALHDAAWASRSVREFWGLRWNKTVGAWLREHFHEPLRRRGHPRAGIAAAFVASAVVHCYLILASVGLYWSAYAALFFLAQLPILAAERAFGVAAWRPAAARAWTVGVLLAASPLFMEPVAQAIDPLLAAWRS